MKWMYTHSQVVTQALYKYLRCIVDHDTDDLYVLRDDEVAFCITIMKDKVYPAPSYAP